MKVNILLFVSLFDDNAVVWLVITPFDFVIGDVVVAVELLEVLPFAIDIVVGLRLPFKNASLAALVCYLF